MELGLEVMVDGRNLIDGIFSRLVGTVKRNEWLDGLIGYLNSQ